MIEPKHPKLSVVRQCELLELPRATYYRQPKPESDENLELMRVIDETYLAHPFYGSRQMRDHLRLQGYRVNRKRVQRLMRLLELEAIYRKPNTSAPHPRAHFNRGGLYAVRVDGPRKSKTGRRAMETTSRRTSPPFAMW